jgi:tetratricopeptide (TPR) repeat protein
MVNHDLGVAYKNKGLFDDSIKEFNEALKLEPRFEKARDAINKVKRMKALQ